MQKNIPVLYVNANIQNDLCLQHIFAFEQFNYLNFKTNQDNNMSFE